MLGSFTLMHLIQTRSAGLGGTLYYIETINPMPVCVKQYCPKRSLTPMLQEVGA